MYGRLVLLKSVMSFLSIYFLSFFKPLICIISSIESIFKWFFGMWSVNLILTNKVLHPFFNISKFWLLDSFINDVSKSQNLLILKNGESR